jgi:dihydroorotase
MIVEATVEIPRPDDWHVHLRDDSILEAVVDFTARRFRYALVMPNLVPPVTTLDAARAYRDRILAAAPPGHDFRPLMTLYCSDEVSPDDLRRGFEEGVVHALKYYPAGATTNSEAGGSALSDFSDLLEVLAGLGMRLLVHAESTDPEVDIFDREAAFLDNELTPVCEAIPELSVTVEHVSTRAGVELVTAHPRMAASITPHHLARQRSDLLADGMRPDLYCKPVINSGDDQVALVDAATSGDPAFFLGTDSAPHPSSDKYGPRAKAGIFNAAYGLEVVAEVFAQRGRLDSLAAFASQNGAAVYGFEPARERIRLERVDEGSAGIELPSERLVTSGGQEIVLFGAGEAGHWRVSPV